MKKFLCAAAALAFTALPFAAMAQDDDIPASCEAFANTMTTKIVSVFHDPKQTEDQKRQTLSGLFQKAVDTNWIGKFVLSHYWRDASPADQAQYLKLYRDYLTMVYISKFNDESGKAVDAITIASLKPSANAGEFDASTLIKRKGEEDVHVDYALSQAGSKCQVHDIKVEGISLLASQRSEFGALAAKSGVQGVIAAMGKQLVAAQ